MAASAAGAGKALEHHSWLHARLRWMLGDSCTAADLAHDVFVRFLTRPGQQLKEPRAYLTTIARNLVVEHGRRRELEKAWLDGLRYTLRTTATPLTLRANLSNVFNRHHWEANPSGYLLAGSARALNLSATMNFYTALPCCVRHR